MSERCEPPPELRDRDGWHWVQGAYSVGPMLWINFSVGFWQTDGELDQLSPERAHHMGLVYLAPVTPPATVAALVEALEGWTNALDAKREFERQSPGNITKAWDRLFYAVEAAETEARAALALYREAGR